MATPHHNYICQAGVGPEYPQTLEHTFLDNPQNDVDIKMLLFVVARHFQSFSSNMDYVHGKANRRVSEFHFV